MKKKIPAPSSGKGPLSHWVVHKVNQLVTDATFWKVVLIMPVFWMEKRKHRKAEYLFCVTQVVCIRAGVQSHVCLPSVAFAPCPKCAGRMG